VHTNRSNSKRQFLAKVEGWHFAKPSGAPTQYTFLDFHLPPGQLLLGSICNSWLPANAIKGEGGLRTKDEGPSCSQAAIALKLIFIDTFLPAAFTAPKFNICISASMALLSSSRKREPQIHKHTWINQSGNNGVRYTHAESGKYIYIVINAMGTSGC